MENSPAQFHRWVEVIDDAQGEVRYSHYLDEANRCFAPVAYNRGIVKVEIIHARQKGNRHEQNFQSAVLIRKHEAGFSRA